MVTRHAVLVTLLGMLATAPVKADPVAIVENVSMINSSLQVMDYVEQGAVIMLDRHETLVLGYFRSCVQESITGGQVTIGEWQSQVHGGVVTRTRVECDGGRLILTPQQSRRAGVTSIRGLRVAVTPLAEFTVHSRSPIVRTGETAGVLVIERIDKAEPTIELQTADNVTDLSRWHVELAAGGVYRASHAGNSVIFDVDPGAPGGQAPILSRLLRL